MRRLLLSLITISALAAMPVHLLAKDDAKPVSAATMVGLHPNLLPDSFDTWTATAKPAASGEVASADAANAAVLTEFGYKRGAKGTYASAGKTLAVTAFEFDDATGAYGAYTFYLKPGMVADPALQSATSNFAVNGSKAIFWTGDTLVLAEFGTEQADIPALKALGTKLPRPLGSKQVPPDLPGYLPKEGLDLTSLHYAVGPLALAQLQSPLAHGLDFNTGAEVLAAQYGAGTLTLVEYPTPQMAAVQEQKIAGQVSAAQQKGWPVGVLASDAGVAVWRSGPIVAVTQGLPQAKVIQFTGKLHYASTITWNHPEGYVSDAWRAAHLYLGIFALVGILGTAAILLGLMLGGGRALYRVARGRPASTVHDAEFIKLDLKQDDKP